MNNKLILILALLTITSCSKPKNNTSSDIEIFGCWPEEYHYDSTFTPGFHLKMNQQCLDSEVVFDTITNDNGTKTVVGYREGKLKGELNFRGRSEKFEFVKNTFSDSLSVDVNAGGLMLMPYNIIFVRKDTSVTMSVFVSFPDSDVGEDVNLKLTKEGKIKIVSVTEPQMED
ncbi:MAG TPA: hypothetical protein VF598_09790 [Hymenobacter sp.]